jgi:putative protease
MVADYSLYAMNDYAAAFLRELVPDITLTVPVELNQKQLASLSYKAHHSEMIVYGYQQLMVSAQCLQNTLLGCNHGQPFFWIKDRYQKSFYVQAVCKYCYNLIYNGVPTVLFDLDLEKQTGWLEGYRIHFTRETREEAKQVLDAVFAKIPYDGEKTRGHYNRGVE